MAFSLGVVGMPATYRHGYLSRVYFASVCRRGLCLEGQPSLFNQAPEPVPHSQDTKRPISASNAPTAKHAPLTSLAVANYRWFWLSGLAAGFAMQMRQIARGWLVYGISGSPLALAVVMSSMGVSMTFLSPIGGAIADRLSKRNIIFATSLISGLSNLVVAFLISQDLIQLWHLFLISFLDGIFNAFNLPSRQGIIPSLVDRNRVVNAVALSRGAMNVSRIMAPALAGLLIPLIELQGVYLVMAFFNAVAAVTIIALTTSGTNQGDWKDWHLHREVFRGLGYVASNRVLRLIVLLGFTAIVLGMGFQVLLPAFVVEAFQGDATDMGILLAFSGTGGLLGSLGLAFLGNPRRKGIILLGAVFLWAIAVFLFSLTRDSVSASAMLLLVGFASSVFMSMDMAVMQLLSSPDMYGRVMSVREMTWGLMPVGIIPMSAMATHVGTPQALMGAAVLLLVMAMLFSLASKTVRRLET